MTSNGNARTVMLSEKQDLAQMKTEDWLYDDEKLEKFLKENADKYPKPNISFTSILFQFLRQIKIGSDVTRISMPTYLLKPVSHLEIAADYSSLTNGLQAVNKVKDPLQRMKLVLQWFLLRCSWVPQTGIASTKPYNPVLGEFFECNFMHKDSETQVLVEQVSHHPPISSLHVYNEKSKVMFESTMLIVSAFWPSGNYTNMKGWHCVTLMNFLEQYMLTFPAVVAVPGVFSSTIAYGESMVIKCAQTGYEAKVNAQGNSYEGYITFKTEKIVKLSGTWKKECVAEDLATQKKTVLLDVAKELSQEKSTKKIVKPVAQQACNESRRVWHAVSKQLKLNRLDEAQSEKFAIEDNQRRITKERESTKDEWTPKFFVPVHRNSDDGVPIFRVKQYPPALEAELRNHAEELGLLHLKDKVAQQ